MKGYAIVSIVTYIKDGDGWEPTHRASARINDCYEEELLSLNQTSYDKKHDTMSQVSVSFYSYAADDWGVW